MVERLFGTNGVRGVINKDMNVQLAMDMGRAIGMFMGGGVAVGYDSRTSATMVEERAFGGIDVDRCGGPRSGLVQTPPYDIRQAITCRGGVMITASHNPPEFNGIKCIDADGTEMPRGKEEEIVRIYFQRSFASRDWKEVGRMRQISGAVSNYVKGAESLVDRGLICNAGLKVTYRERCGLSVHSIVARGP